jgi:hypothetical protein
MNLELERVLLSLSFDLDRFLFLDRLLDFLRSFSLDLDLDFRLARPRRTFGFSGISFSLVFLFFFGSSFSGVFGRPATSGRPGEIDRSLKMTSGLPGSRLTIFFGFSGACPL